MLDERESFNKLLALNPFPGNVNTDWREGENKLQKVKFYSWMTLDKKEHLVSIFYVGRNSKKLCGFEFNQQIYYDIIVLGITSINDRPKCIVCGNSVEFVGLGKINYRSVCSKTCDLKIKSNRIQHQGNLLKGIPKAKETIEKIKLVKSKKEYKEKVSRSLRNFYKTERGLEQRKRISKNIQNRNINDKLNGKTINTKKGFVSGKYSSKVWNRDFYYDSSWELCFIKYFDKEKFKKSIEIFDRSKSVIKYNQIDGSSHKYLPDFFIKFKSGKKLVIEIKPESLFKNDLVVRQKYLSGRKYFLKHKIKYVVLTELDLFVSRHVKYSQRLSKTSLKSGFSIFDYL
jgi:hypothetical protein